MPKELNHAYNCSHPESKCPKAPGKSRRHRFKQTNRKLVRSGVFAVTMTCENCKDFMNGIEDYTVTAGIF